jgi:hypothetical protein
LRVGAPGGGEPGVDVRDELFAALGSAQRRRDGLGGVLPGHPVVGERRRLRYDRGDARRLVVVGLREAGVLRDDQVGTQGGDLLEVELVHGQTTDEHRASG